MKKNIYIYYIIRFCSWLEFHKPILVLFFMKTLWFSDADAVLLGTLIPFFRIIFELPTWSIADRKWRKLSFIIWIIIQMIWMWLYIFNTTFEWFVIAALLAWLGLGLQSWSIEALLSDSVGSSKKNFFAVWSWLFYLSRIWAMLTSWILFVINPVLPFVLYIISLVFKLVSLIFIDERNFEKSNEKTNSRQIKNAFIEMKNKPDVFLFSILLIIFIWSGNMFWHVYWIIFPQHWLSDQQVWYMYALGAFVSFIFTYFVVKTKKNEYNILFNMLLWTVIVVLFFTYWNFIWILIWYIIISSIFSYQDPIMLNFIWKRISSKNKATVLSIVSMWWMLTYVLVGFYATFCLKFLTLEFYYLSIWMLVLIVFLVWKYYYNLISNSSDETILEPVLVKSEE